MSVIGASKVCVTCPRVPAVAPPSSPCRFEPRHITTFARAAQPCVEPIDVIHAGAAVVVVVVVLVVVVVARVDGGATTVVVVVLVVVVVVSTLCTYVAAVVGVAAFA